ncbi:MAG TPA: tetratricopeptide repeat protein, partial [Chroococcales cyanobacterium]
MKASAGKCLVWLAILSSFAGPNFCPSFIPPAQASKNPYPELKEDAPSLREIAFEHYLSNSKDIAFDFYEKAVRIAKRDFGEDSSYVGELYCEMGSLALESRKFTKAEGYLDQAVKHSPNSVMARVKLAKLLEIRGHPDEALVQIKAALSRHGDSAIAHEAMVQWLEGQHRDAQAIHESFTVAEAARGALS